jgi:hypothetical protein
MAVAVAGLVASPSAGAGIAEAATCGSSWDIVSSPNVSDFNHLDGVAAVSSSDVWAVGASSSQDRGDSNLMEHWDGTGWSVAAAPGVSNSSLAAASAVSGSDVWAVGRVYKPSASAFHTLIEHWNGSAWSVIKSRNRRGTGNELSGVAAVSASDAWAVGRTNEMRALVEHWDGARWDIVKNPNSLGTDLDAVSAVSSTNVWAVGAGEGTLVEHWNGTKWSRVASPTPGVTGHLLGVSAITASNVWAVGWYSPATGALFKTLIEHWNGSSWSVVSSPNPSSSVNILYGVAGVSSSDVWAVGYFSGAGYRTLVEHWKWTSWSVATSANLTGDDFLYGVDAIASGAFAVGANDASTLVEWRCPG